MLFSMLWICTSVLNISFFDAMDLYECFRYKFSQNDGRRRIFSFYRKIYKAAPILISGWFYKSFSFTLLALCDGTTAQLCKFILPKEIYAFFLLVGEKII